MTWRRRLFVILVYAMMLSGGASLANGSQLHVVATHGILADVARNVAGDLAEISSLVPVGADQHGFVPTPSDLTTVAEADVVFINGAGWEESLLDAVESAGEGGNIVNASACVEIRPFGVGMGHDDHEDDDHADHDHDDEHAEDDDHADHDHDDEHAEDDDHADHDHDDEHAEDDDHADHEHDEDEHADDDDHADHDHDDDDDEHRDEHADHDHDDEHAEDDDHADHDHDDEHAHDDHDDMASDVDCDGHDAEVAAIVGEEEDGHAHFETMGRARDIDCAGGHDHHDDGHGHDHGEGSCDPHLWMDPHNVIYWALMIRDSLSALDHANEDAYAANAAAYAQELVSLEADVIIPALAELPEEKRVLVTNHGSLGYFATSYDFEIVTMVVHSVSTEVEPSARDVAAVVDAVRDEGVPAIFSDIHLSDVLVNTIASETGVAVVGLHTDSLGDSEGPAGTYLDYMRYNVTAIVEALKGDWH